MARITLIDPESATAEIKEIYEKALRGKPGYAQKALAHRPEMLKNFLELPRQRWPIPRPKVAS